MAQLILPIGVEDARGMGNFLDSSNRKLLEYLRRTLAEQVKGQGEPFTAIYIWGEASAGKSHLLSALTDWVAQNEGRVARVENELQELNANEYGRKSRIYLLDDIELYLQDLRTARRLLTLLESLRQSRALLVAVGRRPVTALNSVLPDLASRLQAFQQFQLQALGEEERRQVVRQRAKQRGIVLSEEVLNWLFTHTGRELSKQLEFLERIDSFSLEHKRRVTIPLIRSILEGGAES